jgi:hypothetical protein
MLDIPVKITDSLGKIYYYNLIIKVKNTCYSFYLKRLFDFPKVCEHHTLRFIFILTLHLIVFLSS